MGIKITLRRNMRKFAYMLLISVAIASLTVPTARAENSQNQNQQKQDQKHKVTAGESLSTIAQNYNFQSWRPIWNVNPQITNPDVVNVDEDITIPAGDTQDRPLPDGYGDAVTAVAPVAVVQNFAPARKVSGPVSGDIFGRIRMRESGNNYANKNNPNYRGAYQFDYGTWNNFGGYHDPADAPPAVQDQKAQQTYAARGCSPWPNTCY
jgi:hypothetical protein